MATFTCPQGTICSDQARTFVGATTRTVDRVVPGTQGSTRKVTQTVGGTGIYHRTVTKVTQQDSNGRVTGGETVIYIEKNGTWQPAAITKDGGKTYQFSDPNYPLMDGVAGSGLQRELNTPNGAIKKNADVQISRSLDRAGVKPADKTSLLEASKNSAPKDNPDGADGDQNNPQEGEPSALTKEQQDELEKDVKTIKSGTRKEYGDVWYPQNLSLEKQDCIKFSIIEYKPSGLSQEEDDKTERIVTLNGNVPSLGKRNILGTITLPIPGGISDSNSVDWSGDQLTEIQKAFANIAQATISDGGGAGAQAASNEAQKAKAPEVKSMVVSKFTEMATGAANIMQRQYGAIGNPNLELLFMGPSLRTFSFTFRMSPRNPSEAQAIKLIIRYFKQAMSVKRSEKSLLLKSPHTFAISYLSSNKQHPYLNRFKECALTSCNVNYTPDGNYMTFAGEPSMTSYELQLQFQELVPLYDDEYGTDNATVGF